MLKMERGAARAAGRSNSRVVDMDELKRARERRASSARHPSEQGRDFREETRRTPRREPMEQQQEQRQPPEPMTDDRPFWEKDSPFAERETPFWQQERPTRGMDDREPRRAAEPRQKARREPPPPPPPERRGASREQRQQDGPAERRKTARHNDRNSQAGLKALLIMLALLALTVFIGLKVFEIQDIEVKGAETMTPENVIALSGIARGENIFKTSLTQARQNLESDPLVEVLGISRIFPDKIKIEIRQRKPHAAVAWLDGYAIIDERGFALDVRDSLPAGQFPLITGIDIEPARRGEPIKGVEDEKLEIMQELLTALRVQQALPLISEINLADTGRLAMLTAEGLQIDLGRATDLDVKAKWVAGSIPELRRQGYTSGILYVTGPKGPVYSAGTTEGGENTTTESEEEDRQDGETAEGDGNGGEGGPDNAA